MRRRWLAGTCAAGTLIAVSFVARAQPVPPGAEAPPPPPAPPGAAAGAPQPAPPPPATAPPAAAPPYQPPAYGQPGTPPGGPPPGPYGPPPQGMYVAAPPPPPPPAEDPGRHLHDGFYLRMSLGAGAMRSTIESEAAGSPELKVRGGGAAFDLWIGGTPTPGLVIGGAILFLGADEPTVEADGQDTGARLQANSALIGPFIDGFFDPTGGFHLGGALGGTSFEAKDKDDPDDTSDPFSGGGGAFWVGYDGWISDDWSLGGLVRLTGSSGRRERWIAGESVTEQATTATFAILFTALYH